MSNKLFKIPSAATTGKPGTPARPAYCETKAVKETTGVVPIYKILSLTVIDGPTIEDPTRPVTGIVRRQLIGYTAGTTTIKYVRTCYPTIPAVPGIPGAPATQSPGWNGGARTIRFITGNGAFRFHVRPDVVGAVVGIGASPDPAFSFNVVTHGFYASRGSYTIMESGNPVFGPSPNSAAQEFAVNVVGTTVQYLVDGVVVHTSVVPRSGIAFPTAVLYLAGDSVDNASITAPIAAPASASGEFLPMVATGVISAGPILSFTAAGRFEPMTSEGEGQTPVSASGSLAAMTSIGSDRPVAAASGAMDAMTGAGEMGVPVPVFAAATGTFAPMLLFGVLSDQGPFFYDPLTSLGDASAAWRPAEWDGTTVYIVSGAGAGQSAAVVGNNSHVLWLESGGGWAPVPEGGSDYEIRDAEGNVLYRGTASAPTGPQTLRPMVGLASEGAYAESRVVMEPLTGAAFQFLALDGVAELTLGTPCSLWTWAHQVEPDKFAGVMPKAGLVGYSGVVSRVKSRAAELWIEGTVDVVGRARLRSPTPALDASGTLLDRGQARLRAPSTAVQAFSGAVAAMKAPAPQLLATGAMLTVGRAATRAPRVKLWAIGGATARTKAPAASLQASGTIMDTGRAAMLSPRSAVAGFSGAAAGLIAPRASLDAAGASAIIARARLALRHTHIMRAFSGALLTQRLSRPTLQAAGVKGAIGRSRIIMPAPLLAATGQTAVFGRAVLSIPAPLLRTGLNTAELVAPNFRLSALAEAVDSALREAWAINLDAGGEGGVFAATHYTGFPIQQIVEFEGSAYGITATGLYRLEGETDEAAPIPWSVKTTPTDYGSIQLKRAITAYLGGNLGANAMVSVFVDQKSTESYTYPNLRGPRLQNHRVQFGRGMASRHYACGVSDATGGQLELQSLDVEIVPIGRAV